MIDEKTPFSASEDFPEVAFAKNFTQAGYHFFYASNFEELQLCMEKIFKRLGVRLVFATQEPVFDFLSHFDIAFTQNPNDTFDLIMLHPISISESGGIKSIPFVRNDKPILFVVNVDKVVFEKGLLLQKYPSNTCFLMFDLP